MVDRCHISLCALLVAALGAAPARGQASEPAPEPAARNTASPAVVESFVPGARRFEFWDYVATGAVLGLYYAIELGLDGPRGAEWTQPLPIIDAPVRRAVRLRTRAGRERADRISDYLWYGTTVYPVAAALLAPLARGKGIDFAWQLGMMNLQAYALSSVLVRLPTS